MPAGVAAGHPATAEVGLRTLAAGGSAADAAVAAMLACCVAESILTGIGGGGFATYYDAATGTVTCLDFFCAVPGLDGDVKPDPMVPIEVSFGDVPMNYMIGGASVAVPGVPPGAGEVHRRWGRLPWHASSSRRSAWPPAASSCPTAQARTLLSVAPALMPGRRRGDLRPRRAAAQGGDLLHHPGLDDALAALAEQGPAAFYTGSIGDLTRRGGPRRRRRARPGRPGRLPGAEVPVAAAPARRHTVSARTDLNSTIATIARPAAAIADHAAGTRAVALAKALLAPRSGRLGDTTNISVVDAEGNACVITLTLGIGSGVWLPGHGFTPQLDARRGRADHRRTSRPGERMSSNMCPLVVVDDDGAWSLAAGSAGASRIRTALIGTLINVLVDGEARPTPSPRPGSTRSPASCPTRRPWSTPSRATRGGARRAGRRRATWSTAGTT